MRWLSLFLIPLLAAPAASAQAGDLKLLISIESPTVTAPFPARLTLHLHNSGQRTLWIYTPVRDPVALLPGYNPFATEELGPATTSGGSTLEVHLQPEGAAATAASATPAEGKVLEVAGLPHPKLVALAPGDDYEEKTVVHLSPANSGAEDEPQPLWGRYRLSVTYRARYSNGANLERILGVGLWTNEAVSNTIEVELQPPAADANCSVEGIVQDVQGSVLLGMLVSLSDQQERLLDQMRTGEDGKFSFTHLPTGFYWVTARRLDARQDTAAFQHAEPGAASPSAYVELVSLPQEIHRAERLLHKPVLFRVFDADGRPLRDVSMEDTWSSGTVLEKLKGRTSDDGTLALEMIPGRNYLTLKRRGCPKQEERVDVQPGSGLDGFKLVFDCGKR